MTTPLTTSGPDYQVLAMSMAADDLSAMPGLDLEHVWNRHPTCLPLLQLYYSKAFSCDFNEFCLMVGDRLHEMQLHMPPNPVENIMCYSCGRHSNELKSCSRCLRGMHCDAKCQKENWNLHKTVCGWTRQSNEELDRRALEGEARGV
jgi:hypothetical protein